MAGKYTSYKKFSNLYKKQQQQKNIFTYHTKQEIGKKHMCFEVLPECHP